MPGEREEAGDAGLAFIGLGHMGGPMSRRLAEAGLDLTVFDLDAARAAPALEHGARLAGSAAGRSVRAPTS